MKTPSDLVRIIDQRIQMALGTATNIKSQIDPSYSSGAPQTVRPEDGGTAGGKTKKVLRVYAIKPIEAEDDIVEAKVGDDTVVLGSIGDPSTDINATEWRGVPYVKAGNTTTAASANTERSNATSTFTTVKRVKLYNPGRYRTTFQLKRSTSDSAEARLVLLTTNGSSADDATEVSSTATESGTSYASKTLDMIEDATTGSILALQIRNTGAGTAEAQNFVVKFDEATAAATPVFTVLQD